MSWYQTIRQALRSLRRNKLRSFFMMLGVTIGIASLTAMSSVGDATRQETMRRFKRMIGSFDIINVHPGAARTRGMPSLATVEPSLKFADARAIAEQASAVRHAAPVQFALGIDVKHRDKTSSSAVFGVSADWMEMRGFNVATGSVISPANVKALDRVVVIGADVRKTLFPDEDPIGKTIRIAGIPFQVIGAMTTRGVGPGGASMDNFMIIPVTTASKRLFNRDYLTSIAVQLKDPEQSELAHEQIAQILRERHGIVPPAEDDFTMSDPRAVMAQISQLGNTLAKILTGIAIIATLIGGVVIMSLMLIAVSERRREIGVRRAIGATRMDVMVQFLVEAATVSAIGGLIGVALGVGGATVVVLQQQLPPVIGWAAVGYAVLLSVGVGLIFGLQPAWRAANVDPIEALRP